MFSVFWQGTFFADAHLKRHNKHRSKEICCGALYCKKDREFLHSQSFLTLLSFRFSPFMSRPDYALKYILA